MILGQIRGCMSERGPNRAKRSMIASGAAFATAAGLSSCAVLGPAVTAHNMSNVTGNGPQSVVRTLDCSRTIVVDRRNHVVSTVDNQPRSLTYIGDQDNQHRMWAAQTNAVFGEVVYYESSNGKKGGLKSDSRWYMTTWFAQKNTGLPQTTDYATGNGKLPSNWSKVISHSVCPS